MRVLLSLVLLAFASPFALAGCSDDGSSASDDAGVDAARSIDATTPHDAQSARDAGGAFDATATRDADRGPDAQTIPDAASPVDAVAVDAYSVADASGSPIWRACATGAECPSGYRCQSFGEAATGRCVGMGRPTCDDDALRCDGSAPSCIIPRGALLGVCASATELERACAQGVVSDLCAGPCSRATTCDTCAALEGCGFCPDGAGDTGRCVGSAFDCIVRLRSSVAACLGDAGPARDAAIPDAGLTFRARETGPCACRGTATCVSDDCTCADPSDVSDVRETAMVLADSLSIRPDTAMYPNAGVIGSTGDIDFFETRVEGEGTFSIDVYVRGPMGTVLPDLRAEYTCDDGGSDGTMSFTCYPYELPLSGLAATGYYVGCASNPTYPGEVRFNVRCASRNSSGILRVAVSGTEANRASRSCDPYSLELRVY